MEWTTDLTKRDLARDRENRIKLDLLCSIARSERALSRLLEQTADLGDAAVRSEQSDLTGRLAAIARCHAGLLYYVSGISLRHPKRGTPGAVWLSEQLSHTKTSRSTADVPDAP